MKKIHHQLGNLIIKNVRGKGRGVFTTKAIKKGAIVEICPVIPFSAKDTKMLEKTLMGNYIYEWGKSGKLSALTLGYGAMYNHSARPNIDFDHRESKNQIIFNAIRNIRAGEELLSNYHNDEDHYADSIDEWAKGPQVYQ